MSFVAQLTAFSKKAEARETIILRIIAAQAMENLVNTTPSKTGHGKRNWRIQRNYPPNPKSVLKGKDQTGDRTIKANSRLISKALGTDTIYIYNNLFYVRFLNDGTVKLAPKKMIERTQANGEVYVRFAVGESQRLIP